MNNGGLVCGEFGGAISGGEIADGTGMGPAVEGAALFVWLHGGGGIDERCFGWRDGCWRKAGMGRT